MTRYRSLARVLAVGLCVWITGRSEMITQAFQDNFLRRGQETVIEYGKQYAAYVDSREKAAMAITEYGIRQRALYDNPEVEKIELQMEQEYGILSVNLGEIDIQTAKDIEAAFAYMYQEYPVLDGTLTNLTLANFPNHDAEELALTQIREFMMKDQMGNLPFVTKTEILLNAVRFFDREKMLSDCRRQAEEGHWPEGTNITSVIVHELGHQLVDVLRMQEFGLYDGKEYTGYYITEENHEAYSRYVTDSLAVNQTIEKRIVEQAYKKWMNHYGEQGTPEEFRSAISGYASGIQSDGGVSYGETIAEAIADVYLNDENASSASRAILDCIPDIP